MFEFVPRSIPSKIFVIGAGGTGSRLIPLLAQFMKTVTYGESPHGHVMNPVIYLVDDDVVEAKNLARQNFIQADVGKPKAAVLAARYSRAFGVNIVPILKRCKDRNDLSDGLSIGNYGSNVMVIMCVDTVKARQDILYHFGPGRQSVDSGAATVTPFFIDAGNEDDFGQVRFFNRMSLCEHRESRRTAERLGDLPTPCKVQIGYLPMDIDHYMTITDRPGGSCADLDQTLAINALMATLIMGVVQNYYYCKPFSYSSISISLGGSVSTTPLTLKNVLKLVTADTGCNPGYRMFGSFTEESGITLIDNYVTKQLTELRKLCLVQTVPAQGEVEVEEDYAEIIDSDDDNTDDNTDD